MGFGLSQEDEGAGELPRSKVVGMTGLGEADSDHIVFMFASPCAVWDRGLATNASAMMETHEWRRIVHVVALGMT